MNSTVQSLDLLSHFVKSEKALKYLNVARNSCNLMLFLVNDILDFSQQEQNKMMLNMDERVCITQLIKDCLEILRFKAETKKIELL